MKDIEAWAYGVAAVEKEFSVLSCGTLSCLDKEIEMLVGLKKRLHDLTEQVAAAACCKSCGGECCKSGRYHVTAVDLLAYLVTEKPVFTPLFAPGWCPFNAGSGCVMLPEYRPFTCITFNCDQIEDLFSPASRQLFALLEQDLRSCYGKIRGMFAGRVMHKAVMDMRSS